MRRLHDLIEIVFRLVVLDGLIFIVAVDLRQGQL